MTTLTRRQAIWSAVGAFFGVKAGVKALGACGAVEKAAVPPVITPVPGVFAQTGMRGSTQVLRAYLMEAPAYVGTQPCGEAVWGVKQELAYAALSGVGRYYVCRDGKWVEVPWRVVRATDCGGRAM